MRHLHGAAARRVQRVRGDQLDGEFIGGFLYSSGLLGKGANDLGGSFNLEAFEQLRSGAWA